VKSCASAWNTCDRPPEPPCNSLDSARHQTHFPARMLGVRSDSSFVLSLVTLVCISNVIGCKRDLGECNLDGQTPDRRPIDGPAAFDIAYRFGDSQPMYEGQALVQSSCAGGVNAFCHSPAAVGTARIGVPAQLDFDARLACTTAACASPPSCEGSQTDTPYCRGLRSLSGNQSNIRDWAEGMIQEIRAGAMPPGEAGRTFGDSTAWIRGPRAADPAAQVLPTELPKIGSKEAEEIIRNWLACQAPVIARTEIAPSQELQLQSCSGDEEPTCIFTGPPCVDPDNPSWSDIYTCLIFTQCVTCHGPLNGNPDQNPVNLGQPIPGGGSATGLAALDLTGSDPTNTMNWATESWLAVVNAPTADPGQCAGRGTLVIPNDSAGSIMIQKMRDLQDCGDRMPPSGDPVIEDLIQAVEDWINLEPLGAPNN